MLLQSNAALVRYHNCRLHNKPAYFLTTDEEGVGRPQIMITSFLINSGRWHLPTLASPIPLTSAACCLPRATPDRLLQSSAVSASPYLFWRPGR